jgi:hypothetical protein
MNAVTTTTAPARTVAGVAVPSLSPWLREAMAHAANPHPDIGLEPALIRPGVREEAARAADAMGEALRAATADEWLRFMQPLAALPPSPSRAEFPGRVSAIAFALADIPASVLTVDRQREALRTLRFWPTPHDLDQILRPAVKALRSEQHALRTIANAPRAGVTAPSADEREAMAAKAIELAAELRAKAREAPASKPTARPLDPAALIAAYEATGTPAALYRARILREQHGDPA